MLLLPRSYKFPIIDGKSMAFRTTNNFGREFDNPPDTLTTN